MDGMRTLAWWATRIEFAIGIGVVLLVALRMFVLGEFAVAAGASDTIVFGPVPVALLLGPMVGLTWMIAIYRRRGEPEPPPWRFRDR